GVLWLPLEDGLEQSCALELVGIGLVGGRCRYVERDRVGDLGLIILGVAQSYLFFGLKVVLDACPMIDLVIVYVHGSNRIDVVALALRLGPQSLALLHGLEAEWQIAWRWGRVRIVKVAESNAPIGDGTFGIRFENLFERAFRCAVPERVLIEHAAVE